MENNNQVNVLKQYKSILGHISEDLPICIRTFSPERHKILFANQSYLNNLGLSKEEFENELNRIPNQLLSKKGTKNYADFFTVGNKEKVLFLKMQMPNGSKLSFYSHKFLIEGTVDTYYEILIPLEKNVSKRIQEEVELFDTIGRHDQDGLLIINDNNRVFYYNNSFRKFFHLTGTESSPEILQVLVQHLRLAPNAHDILLARNKILNREQREYNETIFLSNERVLELHISFLRTHHAQKQLLYRFTDKTQEYRAKIQKEKLISELQEHETELKVTIEELMSSNTILLQQEREIKAVFQNASEAIFTIGPKDNILTANESAMQLFNINRNFLRACRLSGFLNKEDTMELFKFYYTSQKDTGDPVFRKEVSLKTLESQNFTGLLSMRKISEPPNLKFVAIITDLTEEQKRREVLLKGQKELESLLEAKTNFISVMSHEIRTPLNAIVGMSELLLDSNPREDQLEQLDTLKYATHSLMLLINDILDYSKIQAKKLDLESLPVNLRDIFRHTKELYTTKTQVKGIELVAQVDSNVPIFVKTDPIRVGQILNNLVSNAIKFTDKGSVKISLVRADQTLIFKVSDTGKGISPEKKEHIFEKFAQENTAVHRKYGGTGLGLSIVQELVELFNGEISVESELEKGSIFTVSIPYMPVDESEVSKLLRSRQEIENKMAGLAVLYVEDVLPNQFLMKGICAQWDIDLTIVDSGEACLELLEKSHFDIILMDIQMPGIDGYETTEKIRAGYEEYGTQVPVVAVTAAANTSQKEQYTVKQFDDVLPKPLNRNNLYDVLYKAFKSKTELRSE